MSIHPAPKSAAFTEFFLKPAAFAAATLFASASFAASAEELRPIQARNLELGALNGVAYYTIEGEGYRLVATLAGEAGPVRFESTLLPGQAVVFSIPGLAGAAAETAEFSRRGDRLLVETNLAPTQ